MKTLFLIVALSATAFSQDIRVLPPGVPYTPQDTAVAMTRQKFGDLSLKLKTLLADSALYQKQISLLTKNLAISDSLEKTYAHQLQNRNDLVSTLQMKDSMLVARDSLYMKKAEIYKGLVEDLQAGIEKNKEPGFMTNTFWFGTGAIVGATVVYLSSLIVQHIK